MNRHLIEEAKWPGDHERFFPFPREHHALPLTPAKMAKVHGRKMQSVHKGVEGGHPILC